MNDLNLTSACLDPISRLFGAVSKPDRGGLDLSIGALRDVPALAHLWDGLDLRIVTEGLAEYPTTQGPEDLRYGFARLFENELAGSADPGSFVATHGALDALGHVLRAISPDRVLYPAPGFDVSTAAHRMSIVAQSVPWAVNATVGDLLDVLEHELRSKHSGRDAIVVNFPSNPSGAAPTEDEWQSLILLAAEVGATLVIDDVYRFSARPTRRPGAEAEHVVVVDSVSKRLGLPGLRLGYAMLRRSLLSGVRASIAETSVGVSLAAASLGAFGIERYCADMSIAGEIRAELDRRRIAVRGALSPAMQEALVLAEEGLYGCLLFETSAEETRVREELAARTVYLTSGAALSDGHIDQPFLRFCLGSTSDIPNAFERINAVMDLSPTNGAG
ncbi:MAG: pyridoxal phosphate-dependent aminotransferase [Actinobacteria bacterium]|nr:pyridoxal phosphate-dependent aminotransferase [Actinomycetota bacterium]